MRQSHVKKKTRRKYNHQSHEPKSSYQQTAMQEEDHTCNHGEADVQPIDDPLSLSGEAAPVLKFNKSAHLNYFLIASHVLPSHYTSLDPSRLSAIYFVVVALDLLDSLECVQTADFIEYIYLLQLHATDESIKHGHFGFVGGTFTAHNVVEPESHCEYDSVHLWRQQQGHIAMTYTALCSLLTLGDDLSRVDRQSIKAGEGFVRFCNA
jgi:prenyltransferase beta subunit